MPHIWGRTISSVFIGGGTPSLFSSNALHDLFSGVRALTALQPNVEITMEANPGTFEQEKFVDFRKLGINRLSIGIQSFNDTHLTTLGRIHCGSEAANAVEIAKQAGFDDINLDLMFGLPNQSEAEALADVQQAIELAPTHISYYELTLEPNTLFAKYPPSLPEDETRWTIHNNGIALLAQHGYERYEISAFAQKNKRCKHNVNYWLFGDYVGIGAGAHSKISFANTADIQRRWKIKHPARYMTAENYVGGENSIAPEDSAIEFMMNALRLSEGFALPVFEQHTGMPLHQWQHQIDTALEKNLLEQDGLQLRATPQGFDFLNDLLELFMPQNTAKLSYPVIPILKKQ